MFVVWGVMMFWRRSARWCGGTPLADVAAKAAAPIGARLYLFWALFTGFAVGRPMWGT